jgi:hypothetical protein
MDESALSRTAFRLLTRRLASAPAKPTPWKEIAGNATIGLEIIGAERRKCLGRAHFCAQFPHYKRA